MKAFPRHTIQFHLEEPKAFQKISISLWEMAIVTGVLARLYRALVLSHGSNSLVYVGGTLAGFTIILLGMTTIHLAYHPLHQWVWRVPAFASVEIAAELVTSAFLIWLKRERNGAVLAHWDDFGGIVASTLLLRGLAIIIWSLILGGVVQLLRTRFGAEDADDVAGIGG